MVLRPTRHKIVRRSSFRPISWLSTEKLKQTQQKQTCIHNKIYYNIKLTQKFKARFGRLLRHLAWKWRRPVLVSSLYKFVTYLLAYLDTYHPYSQPWDPHGSIFQFDVMILYFTVPFVRVIFYFIIVQLFVTLNGL